MRENRRNFLTLLGATAVATAFFVRNAFSQSPISQPQQAGNPRKDEDSPVPPAAATKAILESNEKDIKKSIEKLFDLATELKAEVEKTDSSKVLSLGLVKKAEEIEKLAHEIKSRAKG